jgi:hypothetical protein
VKNVSDDFFEGFNNLTAAVSETLLEYEQDDLSDWGKIMTESETIPEEVQNETDPWLDEEKLTTSTFRMPAEHLKELENCLPDIIEFFEKLNGCKIPRDVAIGHLIMCGSNETIKELGKRSTWKANAGTEKGTGYRHGTIVRRKSRINSFRSLSFLPLFFYIVKDLFSETKILKNGNAWM